MPGDNFSVQVKSEGRDHFNSALKLAWSNAPGGKATHYISPIPEHVCLRCYGKLEYVAGYIPPKGGERHGESITVPCRNCKDGKILSHPGIVMLWHEDSVYLVKAIPLPYAMEFDAACEFLWHWLKGAEFGEEPDQDGSNGKGFLLTTGDGWGHVEGSHYSIVGVYPDWQMYGK